jgi:hypothetical protein
MEMAKQYLTCAAIGRTHQFLTFRRSDCDKMHDKHVNRTRPQLACRSSAALIEVPSVLRPGAGDLRSTRLPPASGCGMIALEVTGLLRLSDEIGFAW